MDLMNRFDAPVRKLFVCHCKELTVVKQEPGGQNINTWYLQCQDKPIHVGFVWLQGTIREIDISKDYLLLDDGTATAEIHRIGQAPGWGAWAQIGSYCMIMGDIEATNPEVKISALKITNLSSDSNAKSLWVAEVLDLWSFLIMQK